MAVIQTNLTCELQEPVKVRYLDGNLFSQDNMGNQINVSVLDGGEPAEISGTVTANVIRADGGTVTATGGTITDNVVSISLPQAAYAVPGLVSIIVKVTADSVVTTIAAVVANVYQSTTDTTIDPGTIIPSITTLISAIETAVASIPADYSSLWTSLAPAFSSSASYVAGQYVTYNGGVYRFNTTHSGSWAAGDVSAVNIGGELSSLKSEIKKNTGAEEITGWINKKRVRTDGDTVNLTPASTSLTYKCLVVDCVAGDVFTLSGKASNSYYTWAFCKDDGTVVSHTTSTFDYRDKVLTAPTNATKFVVNVNVLDVEYYLFKGKTDVAKHNENVAEDANLQSQIDSFQTEYDYDFTDEPLRKWALVSSGKWTEITTGSSRSYTIQIPQNAVHITIEAQENNGTVVGIFDTYTYPPTDDTMPDYCSEYSNRVTVDANSVFEFDVKADIHYLYVGAVSSSDADIMPTVKVKAVKSISGGSSGAQTIINNNTYNITTTPTITTDANGWLHPVDTETWDESGVTDMTGAIMSMLTDTGYCHLAPGIFYVSGNIEMPAFSRIEGCGYGTRIKLMSGYNASTIIMANGCSVENLAIISTLSSNPTVGDTIGSRNGIEWSNASNRSTYISKCKLYGFNGAGILMKDTSTPVNRNLAISDCYISFNTVGIYVQKDSEFHKIANCTICNNHWGYLNRGGNNIMVNCGLDKNYIGAQIDADEGSNNGHGAISNCSINHSGDNNDGYGIIIKTTGRMLIGNCNLYYSKIKLDTTDGNVFTGCGFGQNAGLDVINGECNIMNGCMMRDAVNFPISITNNNVTQIVNCFYRNGTQVTAS